MAEPFKNLIGPELVRTAGRHLQRVWSAFPRQQFVRAATGGLDTLALKARVLQVADALATALPDDFAAAADVLERSLAPARADTDLSALRSGPEGLAGWVVWSMTEFVAARGLHAPDRALQALHAMTQRFSAEFAIRPFLIEHEQLALRTLRRWLDDDSAHVRRLVSEGTRPRLPWGVQLKARIADPSPSLELLERLQDDPSEYVRRSVANHLNDIAKDHPGVVADWLQRHLPDASAQRRTLLKHASRTLIKRGDRRVLKQWGLARPLRGTAGLTMEPATVAVGESVTLTVDVTSRAKTSQQLLIDYVVHHVKKAGTTSAKTWKGWQFDLAPGEHRTLTKRHSLRPVTTRRDYPGRHAVDLVVNGKVVAQAAFELRG